MYRETQVRGVLHGKPPSCRLEASSQGCGWVAVTEMLVSLNAGYGEDLAIIRSLQKGYG